MSLRLDVHIEGLRELRRLLTPARNLYAKPWSDGMRDLASRGGLAAQRGAPVGTGNLQSRIRTAVQRSPFPSWIAIRNRAVRRSRAYPQGFPYPRLLAFSAKHGHKNWLMRAVMPVWGRAEATLNRAGNEIAKRWQGGLIAHE